MALARLIAPYSQFSGKIIPIGGVATTGGQVAMPDKNGRTLVRQYVTGTFGNTASQIAVNNNLTDLSEAIQDVTLEQAEAWQRIAQQITRTGRMGLNYVLNWNQLFTMRNSYALAGGESIVLDPPAYLGGLALRGIESVASDAGVPDQSITVTVDDPQTSGPNGFLLFQVSRAISSQNRLARDNEFVGPTAGEQVILGRTGSAQPGDNVYSFICDKFNLTPGLRCGVRVTAINAQFYPIQRTVLRNTLIVQAA